MSNWKAFDAKKIDFIEGVNFIVGPNGAGKTSVLQAIYFAITGKKPIGTLNLKHLVKVGTDAPARIKLEFQHNKKNYLVERVLSKDGQAAKIYCENSLLEDRPSGVSKYIEDLLSIDAGFFERVIYMSEGDVFQFIAPPPKDDILAQIGQALGINRIKNLHNEVEKEVLRQRNMKEDQERQIEWLDKFTSAEHNEPEVLEEKRRQAASSLGKQKGARCFSDRILETKHEAEELEQSIQRIGVVEREIQCLIDPNRFNQDFLPEIRTTKHDLENRLRKVADQISPKLNERGALKERLRSVSRILRVLPDVGTEAEPISECPICERSLAADEVKKLTERYCHQKRNAEESLVRVEHELQELQESHQQIEQNIKVLGVAEADTEIIYRNLRTQTLGKESLQVEKEKLSRQLRLLESEKTRAREERRKSRKRTS